jgi:hypothetical protein
VWRQFCEIPGIMDGTGRPEYGKVVDICTRDSLNELATPGLGGGGGPRPGGGGGGPPGGAPPGAPPPRRPRPPGGRPAGPGGRGRPPGHDAGLPDGRRREIRALAVAR